MSFKLQLKSLLSLLQVVPFLIIIHLCLVHSLNDTITTLLAQDNITSSEWQTLSLVVALEPFTMPRSFVLQVSLVHHSYGVLL